MVDDQALSEDDDRFPLIKLPDDVLANVLQRCPPGSIAGFPLPLALAQVRLTGSVDPHWVWPLLHAASKCPAVLDRLTLHLRSIELSDGSAEVLTFIMPHMIWLESLIVADRMPVAMLAVLPASLTRLSVDHLDGDGLPPEAVSSSLLRLTALEDLRLWSSVLASESIPGGLPLLRRIACTAVDAGLDLGSLAPTLECLEVSEQVGELPWRVPESLTALRLRMDFHASLALPSLARLTGLRDLALTASRLDLADLPGLLTTLTDLTRLEISGEGITDESLPQFATALETAPEVLGLDLRGVTLERDQPALQALWGRLIQLDELLMNQPAPYPWAALTRLTRLALSVDGRMGSSWVKPLSRLPGLRQLQLLLKNEVPAGLGDLSSSCTDLWLSSIGSTGSSSCIGQLTRLRKCCLCSGRSTPNTLLALPAFLTRLDVSAVSISPAFSLGAALRHLTALEHLRIHWPEGEDRACDLSPLKRLARLFLHNVPCPLVRLGSLPCLRRLYLYRCQPLDDSFLQHLVEHAPSLREIKASDCCTNVLTDASLAPLTRLSLLEVLELGEKTSGVTPEGLLRLLDRLPLLAVKGRNPPLRTDPAWAELKQQAGNRLQM